MKEPKEMEVILSDEVKKQMEEDPDLAEALRDFSAMMRQAMQGVADGKYKSMDDAVEAITGNRPRKVDLDDPDYDPDWEDD